MEVHGKNLGQMERYMFHCQDQLKEKLKWGLMELEELKAADRILKEKEVGYLKNELEIVKCIHLLLLRFAEAENLFFPEVNMEDEYKQRTGSMLDFKDSWMEKL